MSYRHFYLNLAIKSNIMYMAKTFYWRHWECRKTFSKLLKFVLPLVAFTSWQVRFLYGLAGTVGFIAYLAYKRKIGIYASIGKINYAKGDMDKAIKWYRKAASMQGASPDIIISYCYLLLKRGRPMNRNGF